MILRLTCCEVDLERQRVVRGAASVALTTREVGLLRYLAQRPGVDVDRQTLLVDVWGYQPEVVTRTVDTTVRRLRRKIEADPKNPEHLLTVHGVGYRLVVDLPVSQGNVATPAVAANPERVEGSSFRGRSAELTQIRQGLGACPLVTLVGPGGAGKTRLAREYGARVEAESSCGVWFADLARCHTLDEVVRAVARALGVPLGDGHGAEAVARVGRAIEGLGPSLVVLDNLEQLEEGVAGALVPWLTGGGAVRWLATSRVALGVPAERLVPVGPLPEDTAFALFMDRADAASPGFSAVADHGPVVRGLVGALDGLPLAIELAAARVASLSLAAIAARLTDRFRLLRDRDTQRPERHRALWATIEWSWDLLAPWEQSVLAQCAVFMAPFSADAVDGVLVTDRWPDAPWSIDVVEDLRSKSLVQRVGESGSPRFALLESVRAFALAKLDGAERSVVEQRHMQWFARRGDGALAELVGPRGLRRRADLDAELDDVVVGLEHAVAAADLGAALPLLRCAAQVLAHRGPLHHAMEMVDAVEGLGGVSPGQRAQIAEVRVQLLNGARRTGDLVPALVAAVGAASDAGDVVLQAWSSVALSRWKHLAGIPVADPEHDIRRALDAVARTSDVVGAARVRAEVAELRLTLGQVARGAEDAASALDLYRELGSRYHAAVAENRLAVAFARSGRHAEAGPLFLSALTVLREAGDRVGEATALNHLGLEAVISQRHEESVGYYEAALRIHRVLGSEGAEARVRCNLGRVLYLLQRLPEAVRSFERALGIAQRLGARSTEAHIRLNMGLALGDMGPQDLPRAIEMTEVARDYGRQQGDDELVAFASNNLGLFRERQGDLEGAREAYREGLDAAEDTGWPTEVMRASLAAVLARLGLQEDAEQHLRRARRDARARQDVEAELWVRCRRGDIALAAGRLDEARAHAAEVRERCRAQWGRVPAAFEAEVARLERSPLQPAG